MNRMIYVVVLLIGLPFLGGCVKQGKFEHVDLSSLEQGFESRQIIGDVSVSVKHLTQEDREYVFGRKELTFSPVLVTIDNKGKKDLFFDTRKQSFALVKPRVKRGIAPRMWGSSVGVGVGAVATGYCMYEMINSMSSGCLLYTSRCV